jgi:hypothetical protein
MPKHVTADDHWILPGFARTACTYGHHKPVRDKCAHFSGAAPIAGEREPGPGDSAYCWSRRRTVHSRSLRPSRG